MNKLPLTICILTNRTDERLLAAIESAQVAQEVLIIDNNSGNDWGDLIEKYTLTVMNFPAKIVDFAVVRNQTLDHVSNDWVLFLDSDETIDPQSIPELSQVVLESTAAGVAVRRSDIFYGKKLEYGEAGNQPLVRLGRKNALHFVGNVHEKAVVTGMTTFSAISILHHSHPNISEFIAKINVYAQQVAQARTLSKGKLLFQLCTYPVGKFLFSVIVQGGIQDGWQGVVYAACMSLHSVLVRIYIYEQQFLKPAKVV